MDVVLKFAVLLCHSFTSAHFFEDVVCGLVHTEVVEYGEQRVVGKWNIIQTVIDEIELLNHLDPYAVVGFRVRVHVHADQTDVG